MMETLLKVCFAPILIKQGKSLKKSIPRLQPPSYPSHALSEDDELRVLLVGDSSGIGVGADEFDQTLIAQTIRALEPRKVGWQVEAVSGHTTDDALAQLKRANRGNFQVAITALGVNDVTSSLGLSAWLEQTQALWDLLMDEFGVQQIIVSGLPPLGSFPTLRPPLQWYLKAREDNFNHGLARLVDDQDNAKLVELGFDADATHMASDGFHPGPYIYQLWGQSIAELINDIAP